MEKQLSQKDREGGGRKEGGGEEMFALAEIHVRLTILKIRCIIFFYQNDSWN